MTILKKLLKQSLIFFIFSCLIFFSSFTKLSAEEINWVEVGKTNNGIQFVDINSIKYNNSGLLSVLTKYSELTQDDKNIISTNSYLMAIDYENRLFSKLPVDGDIKQVKNWIKPINDKLMKATIINSCK